MAKYYDLISTQGKPLNGGLTLLTAKIQTRHQVLRSILIGQKFLMEGKEWKCEQIGRRDMLIGGQLISEVEITAIRPESSSSWTYPTGGVGWTDLSPPVMDFEKGEWLAEEYKINFEIEEWPLDLIKVDEFFGRSEDGTKVVFYDESSNFLTASTLSPESIYKSWPRVEKLWIANRVVYERAKYEAGAYVGKTSFPEPLNAGITFPQKADLAFAMKGKKIPDRGAYDIKGNPIVVQATPQRRKRDESPAVNEVKPEVKRRAISLTDD